MTSSSPSALTPTERLESIKAGFFGAVVLLISTILVLVIHWGLGVNYGLDLGESWDGLNVTTRGAIALISGGLFGTTYRYAVRTDENPQLRSGVAGAFGLVRSLALVEAGLRSGMSVAVLALWSAETMVQFAIAAQVLTYAMHRGWIKPFQS